MLDDKEAKRTPTVITLVMVVGSGFAIFNYWPITIMFWLMSFYMAIEYATWDYFQYKKEGKKKVI